MASHLLVGRVGEDLAARRYRRMGFRVLERNWRCPEGEIDLIAVRRGVIVFCEVKTRRSLRCGHPAEAVDFRRQVRLRRAAARWLAQHGRRAAGVRFDVVAVTAGGDGPEVTVIPGAF
jgi:putative endonuclease